jgi:hypothetical protein
MNSPKPTAMIEHPLHDTFRSSASAIFHLSRVPVLALIALIGLVLGCASSSRDIPRADHMHGPIPHQVRRAPNYASMTFWSHLNHEVYEPVEGLPGDLSIDQELTIREFGQPDYWRDFTSLEGENVTEWLNIDHGVLHQFVDGEKVFQGDIRDLEHTLLRYGAPNEVSYRILSPQIERVLFMYQPAFSRRASYFDFANGALVHQNRHP